MDRRNQAIQEAFEEAFKPISRRVHSMTWRDEERVCVKCLKPFMARIAKIDGEDYQPITACPECWENERKVADKEDADLKLTVATNTCREEWRQRCGMETELQAKTFDNFDVTRQPEAFKLVKGHNMQSSLMLCSCPNKTPDLKKGEKYSDGYGLGKTHLLAALSNRILETEPPARLCQGYYIQTLACPVHWTTEPDMLARITATYRDGATETEELIFRQLTLTRYLFIDDVAKYQPKDPSFLQRVFYRIINSRAITNKPVFLTANLRPTDLEQYIGGASADRLRGMCGAGNIITMAGKSFRRG